MGKVRINRTASYRITNTKGVHKLLGHRVRFIIPTEIMDFEVKQGYVEGLQALILSGPQVGSVVDMPPCRFKMIKANVCHCTEYPYPHAPGLGKCKQAQTEQIAEDVSLDTLFIPGKEK